MHDPLRLATPESLQSASESRGPPLADPALGLTPAAPAAAAVPVQLFLLPAPRPLLERFGARFFAQVPPQPGVYLMAGDGGQFLYIGQSGHLRRRLNSYKRLQPHRVSRKLARLLGLARSITWETCASAEAARLRENELLRLHKPKLNVLNTRPELYHYLGLRILSNVPAPRLEMRLTREAAVRAGEQLYGAFKGLGLLRRAYSAALRAVWLAQHPGASPAELPRPLLAPNPPTRYSLPLPRPPSAEAPGWERSLAAFLAGESEGFLGWVESVWPPPGSLALFHQRLLAADREALGDFYRYGPRRNRQLRARFAVSEPLLRPPELDDLLVLAAAGARRPS